MIVRTGAIVLALILTASCAAEVAQTKPASRPPTTTRPSTAAADPAVMKILKDLEAAGEKYATIRGDVTMEIVDHLTGDSEERSGWLAYQQQTAKTPAKFRIHFDTLRQGAGRAIKNKLDYAFDGHYMTVARHSIREMTRYQVAAEGEKVQPTRLGKGPFPLPFGQKADDVLERFHVITRPAEANEPKKTLYLKFIPRRKYYKETHFKRLEMWIDPKMNLPARLVSQDKKKKTTKVTFKNVQTNLKLDQKKIFEMPRPLGWTYKVERLGD